MIRKQREEPTSPDIPVLFLEIESYFGTSVTGGAWLSSSCREMLGWESRATPIVSCHHSVGQFSETGNKLEEGGDESNHHAPYDLGWAHVLPAAPTSWVSR